jgi:hypothetical protein
MSVQIVNTVAEAVPVLVENSSPISISGTVVTSGTATITGTVSTSASIGGTTTGTTPVYVNVGTLQDFTVTFTDTIVGPTTGFQVSSSLVPTTGTTYLCRVTVESIGGVLNAANSLSVMVSLGDTTYPFGITGVTAPEAYDNQGPARSPIMTVSAVALSTAALQTRTLDCVLVAGGTALTFFCLGTLQTGTTATIGVTVYLHRVS